MRTPSRLYGCHHYLLLRIFMNLTRTKKGGSLTAELNHHANVSVEKMGAFSGGPPHASQIQPSLQLNVVRIVSMREKNIKEI